MTNIHPEVKRLLTRSASENPSLDPLEIDLLAALMPECAIRIYYEGGSLVTNAMFTKDLERTLNAGGRLVRFRCIEFLGGEHGIQVVPFPIKVRRPQAERDQRAHSHN
jgi:hypothetical protein